MKKECIPVMGFRHSHIGINFPSKRIYIYIYIEFHLIQNLNPIGIKISNQFVCCYLINPIKSGLKKMSYEQKEKRKHFFLLKKGNFSFITKIKEQTYVFFKKNKRLLYIITFFLQEKEKVFTLNSNIITLFTIFFFITLSKNIFGKSV